MVPHHNPPKSVRLSIRLSVHLSMGTLTAKLLNLLPLFFGMEVHKWTCFWLQCTIRKIHVSKWVRYFLLWQVGLVANVKLHFLFYFIDSPKTMWIRPTWPYWRKSQENFLELSLIFSPHFLRFFCRFTCLYWPYKEANYHIDLFSILYSRKSSQKWPWSSSLIRLHFVYHILPY